MTNPKIDQFDLSNVSPQRVARAAFRVIDRLQDYKAHEQTAALAAALLITCEALGIDNPQDIFTVTRNMLQDERAGGQHQFVAVRHYAQNEIGKAA